MKIVWKTKDGEKTITKVVINGKAYNIKGITNMRFTNNKNIEKVIEVGDEVDENTYRK